MNSQNRWQLQDAKAKLSEVVKSAGTKGPQEITLHGRPAAVVLSIAEYERLKGQKPSFVDFIRHSALAGARLRIVRNPSLARDVDL